MFIAGGVFFFIQFRNGKFRDLETFQQYIQSFGSFGPIILCVFQCFKVIYACIPGTIGYIAGPTLFGTFWGIISNYVGICAGSLIVFCLSKKYGSTIMCQIFSEKRYKKYMKWIKKRDGKLSLVLWLLLLIPFSPDDFICYFAGLTDMKFRRFLLIILTVKPWCIIAYGLIFGTVFN